MANPSAISSITPEIFRRLSPLVVPDSPGLRYEGAGEESEHRRQLTRSVNELISLVVAAETPTNSFCTTSTTTTGSPFIPVVGMTQTVYAPFHGVLDIRGVLFVEVDASGLFKIRIRASGTAVWVASGLYFALVLTPTRALVPFGAPALVDAVGGTVYSVEVQVGHDSGGIFTVIGGAGSVGPNKGKESYLQTWLRPTLGVAE